MLLSALMVTLTSGPAAARNSSLANLASEAGAAASSRVFPATATAEAGAAAATIATPQSDDVLRNRCLTRAENALRECQENNGQDCTRIYETQVDACLIAHPTETSFVTVWKWYLIGAGVVTLLGFLAYAT